MEGQIYVKKIDRASLIVGRKFTVFALFYFVFEGNFQVQAPGGLIFGGAILRRVFCVISLGGLYLEGLRHGGAYFRNFTVAYFTVFERKIYMVTNMLIKKYIYIYIKYEVYLIIIIYFFC